MPPLARNSGREDTTEHKLAPEVRNGGVLLCRCNRHAPVNGISLHGIYEKQKMKKALIAIYLLLFCALPALADDRQQIVGVWKLQMYNVEFQNTGETKAPFGANPNGYIIFTPDGRMMAILTAEGRKAPQTDADRVEAFRSMAAYSGIYRLEEDRWTTMVDITWNEAWIGTEQVRFYRVEGDTLTVTTAWRSNVIFNGRVTRSTLTWAKMR